MKHHQDDEVGRSRVLNARAWEHQTWDPHCAARLARQALDAAERGADPQVQAHAWLTVAFHEMHVGDLGRGSDALMRSRSVLEPSGDARDRWLLRLVHTMHVRRASTAEELERMTDELRDSLCESSRPEDRYRAASLQALTSRKMGRYEESLKRSYEASEKPCEPKKQELPGLGRRLPAALRASLREALGSLDALAIERALQGVREFDFEAAAAMVPLVQSFRYERLLELLDQGLGSTAGPASSHEPR